MPRRMCVVIAFVACTVASTALAQMPPWQRRRPPIRPPVPPRAAALIAQVDSTLARSARFFVESQSPDGAWRSKVYESYRDGPSLTAYVMSTLFFLPQGGEDAREAFHEGLDYLMGMVGEDGRIKTGSRGLSLPVLTAATASRVLVLEEKTDESLRAEAAWLAYLRERQLVEGLGWAPSDPAYGGWGFSIDIPRKPAVGTTTQSSFESNLTATVFGVAALKTAKVRFEDPGYVHALVFVKRCQNYAEDPKKADAKFDDGGFFFIPSDSQQNKAGAAGTDRHGTLRFHSYGTTTADGLRAMIQCGVELDDPRVLAARKWLEEHFTVETNPGTFAPDREALRNASYYYYCWALAHAFMRLDMREFEKDGDRVDWAAVLAKELIRRQRSDGTWANGLADAGEDDPLIATSSAAGALAICRRALMGDNVNSASECLGPGGPRM